MASKVSLIIAVVFSINVDVRSQVVPVLFSAVDSDSACRPSQIMICYNDLLVEWSPFTNFSLSLLKQFEGESDATIQMVLEQMAIEDVKDNLQHAVAPAHYFPSFQLEGFNQTAACKSLSGLMEIKRCVLPHLTACNGVANVVNIFHHYIAQGLREYCSGECDNLYSRKSSLELCTADFTAAMTSLSSGGTEFSMQLMTDIQELCQRMPMWLECARTNSGRCSGLQPTASYLIEGIQMFNQTCADLGVVVIDEGTSHGSAPSHHANHTGHAMGKPSGAEDWERPGRNDTAHEGLTVGRPGEMTGQPPRNSSSSHGGRPSNSSRRRRPRPSGGSGNSGGRKRRRQYVSRRRPTGTEKSRTDDMPVPGQEIRKRPSKDDTQSEQEKLVSKCVSQHRDSLQKFEQSRGKKKEKPQGQSNSVRYVGGQMYVGNRGQTSSGSGRSGGQMSDGNEDDSLNLNLDPEDPCRAVFPGMWEAASIPPASTTSTASPSTTTRTPAHGNPSGGQAKNDDPNEGDASKPRSTDMPNDTPEERNKGPSTTMVTTTERAVKTTTIPAKFQGGHGGANQGSDCKSQNARWLRYQACHASFIHATANLTSPTAATTEDYCKYIVVLAECRTAEFGSCQRLISKEQRKFTSNPNLTKYLTDLVLECIQLPSADVWLPTVEAAQDVSGLVNALANAQTV